MNMLYDFIIESNQIEGIKKPAILTEIIAYKKFLALDTITLADLESFVKKIQPGAKLRRKRGMDVRVDNHAAPSGGPAILFELQLLLTRINARNLTAYETHLRYERLHPFMGGNGRSGRALWLWMMGGEAPLGFLHTFYYQTLQVRDRK